jgi:hypothetical protein
MSEQFRTLSDLPECDNLKESKIQESKNKLWLQDFDEINAWDFSDIDDSDVKGFLKWNMDACKDTTQKKLIVLRNIYNENQEWQVNPEISKEEHNQNMLDLKKWSLVWFNIEWYTEKSWEITHLVAKGQTLWEVIQITYWYTKWSEIAVEIEKAKAYNLSKWVVLNDNVKEWQKINLFIEDIDEVSKRLADRQEEERIERAKNNQIELKKLEESRVNNEWNKIWKSFFKAEIKEEWFKLSLAPYSWELNSDAYEIYSNMKDTRWTQKIGQYRNSNWEIEDIILWDNKWKNIYMELDGSYRWDDIDSWKIDSISSQQELESVMKNLLKKYEKENREDI